MSSHALQSTVSTRHPISPVPSLPRPPHLLIPLRTPLPLPVTRFLRIFCHFSLGTETPTRTRTRKVTMPKERKKKRMKNVLRRDGEFRTSLTEMEEEHQQQQLQRTNWEPILVLILELYLKMDVRLRCRPLLTPPPSLAHAST